MSCSRTWTTPSKILSLKKKLMPWSPSRSKRKQNRLSLARKKRQPLRNFHKKMKWMKNPMMKSLKVSSNPSSKLFTRTPSTFKIIGAGTKMLMRVKI